MNRDELALALDDAYAAGYRAGLRNEPPADVPHPRCRQDHRLWNAWGNGYADGQSARRVTGQHVRRG